MHVLSRPPPHYPYHFSATPPSTETPLKSHFGKGEAELTNFDYSSYSGLEAWADSGFARDVSSRRSTTSTTHKWSNVAFAWQCVKQPEPGASTNDCEMRSLFHASRKTITYRNTLQSLNESQTSPTPTFEDNAATIKQVLNDRLTPRVKHIDVLVSWLNEQFSRDKFIPVSCASGDQEADMNSKPHGGFTLQKKLLPLVGFQFYPPPDSLHYKLLQLDQFVIGHHRGSFLPNGILPPSQLD